MIACMPMGICSWNYSLCGEGHRAELVIYGIGEQGSMRVDGVAVFGGKGGDVLRRVESDGDAGVRRAGGKARVRFHRHFDVVCGDGRYELGAESFAGRTMVMSGGDAGR